MTNTPVSSHYVDVYGSKIHYLEQGQGDPILFLHGMPTSSYLWRNIIPHLAPLGRCIAPDLIGMGKSDKPDIEYTFQDHISHIEKFIETMKLKRVTLVMHGWGSLIGFDYAMRHESNCKGLVFYEAYLRPFHDDDVSLPFQEQLHILDNLEIEHDIVMNGVTFVDKAINQSMLEPLSHEALSHYEEPFLEEGTGKPLFQYLQEMPRGKEKNEINQCIANYSKKLMKSSLPKLMLYSMPGFITTMATAIWAKQNLPNLEVADIGEELHYAQESNPNLMAETISVWLQGVEQTVG